MINEDLFFTVDDSFGNKVQCKILSLFSKNNQNYVIFSDGELDEDNNIVMKYGKLNVIDDEYELLPDLSDNELDYLKENFYEELLELSKNILKKNEG
ncbi:MAG: DUF1292 domain-containing protein [Methanobrevibacter sp.]|nr:DUF1292 domain-containing protein [Methanobrevibacter sp.]